MNRIYLEQWAYRGGQANPPYIGAGGSAWQQAGYYFDTSTHTVVNYTTDYWAVDEREAEQDNWIVNPAEFWEEKLDNGDTRIWKYLGNGQVTYQDVPDASIPICTLTISTVTVKKVSFFGGANGEATINITGAQGSVKYSLDGKNWQSSPTFTGLVKQEGMRAYVQDSRTPTPCRAELQFDVTQETTPPVCDLELQGVTITGNAQANTVTVQASSSHLPIRYTITDWRQDQTSNEFQNLAQGLYNLKVTDAAGCTAETTFQIGVVEPSQIEFSRNPIVHLVTGAAPGQLVELVLWVETEHYKGDYQKIITRRKPALLDGTCQFDLDFILHSLLQRKRHLPNFGSLQEQIINQGILNYYVTTALVNPNTDLAGAPTPADVRTVILGGLPPEELNDENFFSEYLFETGAFLTWLPNTHTIRPDQPEYIYFLNQRSEITTIKVKREASGYGPEITTTVTEIIVPANTAKYRLVQVPVLKSRAPGDIKKVVVTLLDQNNNQISVSRTYKIDWQYAEQTRYFLYENSLGQMETLCCTGPQEINWDSKDELAERGQGKAPYLMEQFTFRKKLEKKIRQSTGLHSQQYHRHLQDFVISHQRYEIKKNRLLPILLQKSNYTYEPNSQKVTGYFFEYDYAFTPIAYANR